MIKNRILKTELVEWRNLIPLKPKGYNQPSFSEIKKIKKSYLNNGKVNAFTVWENKGKTYIIDGHLTFDVFKALGKDGVVIPDKFTANFLDCKDMQEAKRFVLILDSHYKSFNNIQVNAFIEDLDMDSLLEEINIPNLELKYLDEPIDLGDVAETGFQYEERKRIEEEKNKISKERYEAEKSKIEREAKEKYISDLKLGKEKLPEEYSAKINNEKISEQQKEKTTKCVLIIKNDFVEDVKIILDAAKEKYDIYIEYIM